MLQKNRKWLEKVMADLEELSSSSRAIDNSIEYKYVQQIINDLEEAERRVRPLRQSDFLDLYEKVKHKLRYPFLSLMEYDFHENTHSNILEYLFSAEYGHKFGAKLLASFVEGLSEDARFSDIAKMILERKYSVSREHPIRSGRIDLLIQDNNHRFIVLIENKTLSQIGESYDEERSVTISQLKKYHDYFKAEKAAYILLSYRELEANACEPFILKDYKYLLDILNLHGGEVDNILTEYILQLTAMLSPGFKTFTAYRTLLSKLCNDPETLKDLDLNTIQMMKGYFHEIE